MNKNKIAIILCPFLATLYPIIFLYSHNFGEVYFSSTIPITLFMLTLTGLIFAIMKYAVKSLSKTSLLLTLYLLIFFSYTHILNQIPFFRLFATGEIVIGRDYLVLFITCVSLVIISIAILKSKSSLNYIIKFLDFVLILLILVNAISILTKIQKTPRINFDKNNKYAKKDLIQPDIYYIILDGFARDDVLKEIYGYDDNLLIPFLEKKGFFIGSESKANYIYTYMSIASSLNFNYIENILSEPKTPTNLTMLIDKNQVADILKDLGYTYITFNSGFHASRKSSTADIFYDFGIPVRRFGILLIDSTFPGYILRKTNLDLYSFHRNRVLSILDTVKKIPENNQPTFTFIHIVSPHPPFIFDENGNSVNPGKQFSFDDGINFNGNKDEYKKMYVAQLKFISKEIIQVLDEVVDNSPNPPIIILQSDHGPASEIDWENKDSFKSLKTYSGRVYDPNNQLSIKERTGILNAYYLPDKEYQGLYKAITPVNSFRIIFNKYFHTKYKILDDQLRFE